MSPKLTKRGCFEQIRSMCICSSSNGDNFNRVAANNFKNLAKLFAVMTIILLYAPDLAHTIITEKSEHKLVEVLGGVHFLLKTEVHAGR